MLFISDLHLDPANPEPLATFIELLDGRAREADRLYILGDLFEFWIGDDYIAPAFEPLLAALKRCTLAGTQICLMHGNRDFLIGERFVSMTGCTLLDDPTLVTLHGQRVLLMHGDTLCTDDTDYQRFRQTVRQAECQRSFLRKPVAERQAIVRQTRAQSDQATRNKPQAIMDVNQGAVEQAMRAANASLLIHGHTHRPAVHSFELDGEPRRRIVLGDWYHHPSLLTLTPDGHRIDPL